MFFTPLANRPDVIFWDLGQTLIDINPSQIRNHLGKWNIAKHLLNHLSNGPHESSVVNIVNHLLNNPLQNFKSHMRERYFQALENISNQSNVESVKYEVYADDGVTPLPPLLKELLLGNINYNQADELCKSWLENNNEFFKTPEEKEIFQQTFHFNFNPICFAAYQKPLALVSILKQCAEATDENGKKKNICIILSNWPKEAIEPFQEKFKKEITPYIDYWIFSCDGHGAKPSQSIFEHCYNTVCKTYPEQKEQRWFFIDDQEVNRLAAQKFIKHPIIAIHPNQQTEFILKGHRVIN